MLRQFLSFSLFVLLVSSSGFAINGRADEPKSSLEGEWTVVAMTKEGKPVFEVSYKGMKWVFDKDTYTMTPGTTTPAGLAGGPPLKGPFRVDDKKTPHEFSFTMLGEQVRHEISGIYRIKDGKLDLCFGSAERPKTFDTIGTRNLCYTLQRSQSGKEDRPND